MSMLEDRTGIKSRTPMPVQDVTSATSKSQITSESVSFANGAEGTTQRLKLTYDSVMSEYGERIGVKGDTSLSFGTGTVLTTEVPWRFKNTEGKDDETDRLASLANGEFMVDYENGFILGKNATGVTTSSTTDTVNYKVRLAAITSIGGGDASSANQTTQITAEQAIQTAVEKMDDWDEYERAKVSLIENQAGVSGGAGASDDGTLRVVLSTDSASSSGSATAANQATQITAEQAIQTAVQIMDDWDETNRAAVNLIAGQVAITAGAGAVGTNTPRMTLASDDPAVTAMQIIDNSVFVDDAAFTPATSSVNAAGFFADESGTDSVDEGDVGAARITLDRKQITASEYLEDAVFASGGYLSMAGVEIDDPTALAAMTEGDNGNLKGDLSGRLVVTLGTALDVTNDNVSTQPIEPSNVNTTAYAASLVVKASAGTLYEIGGYNSKTTAQWIQIHDAASLPADTAVPEVIIYCAAQSNFQRSFPQGLTCGTGIVVSNSSTGATKTIGSADCWIDATYL